MLKYVKIREFSAEDPLHVSLSELSRAAHLFALKAYSEGDGSALQQIKEIEAEIDAAVARVYGISSEELEEIRKTLAILKFREPEPIE